MNSFLEASLPVLKRYRYQSACRYLAFQPYSDPKQVQFLTASTDSGLDIIANGKMRKLGEAAIDQSESVTDDISQQRNNHGSGSSNAALHIQAMNVTFHNK